MKNDVLPNGCLMRPSTPSVAYRKTRSTGQQQDMGLIAGLKPATPKTFQVIYAMMH